MNKSKRVTIKDGFQIDIPDALIGMDVDWSSFEYTGGNEYAISEINEVIPVIDEFIVKKRRHLDLVDRRRDFYLNILNKTREFTDAINAWHESMGDIPESEDFEKEHSERMTMWSHFAAMFKDTEMKTPDGRTIDVDQWVKDSAFIMQCSNYFYERSMEDFDRKSVTEDQKDENDIAVAEKCRKMIVSYMEFEVFFHALIFAPQRDKKVAFKGAYAAAVDANEALEAVKRNLGSDVVKMIFPTEYKGEKIGGDDVFESVSSHVREAYSEMRKVKKIVNERGAIALNMFNRADYDAHCRKENAEFAMKNLVAQRKVA